jgi:hypothetical protein
MGYADGVTEGVTIEGHPCLRKGTKAERFVAARVAAGGRPQASEHWCGSAVERAQRAAG